MGTLKGQNFRICTYDTTAAKYKVVGMATNCTVTLTNNTDDATTKDDTGMASKPVTISKGWQVQVESLNVADAAAMRTAIKSMTPFTLMWDETATSDNQSREKATFARKGSAYLNDATFNFNDRENSTKSLQFTGTGALEVVGSSEATEVIALGSYTKGQFVRLFLSNSSNPALVVAGAKTLQLHVSMSLEDATTKDTPGTWQVQEPTGLSYDISTNALVASNETITSAVGGQTLATIMDFYESSTLLYWQIANVSGDNQRTKGSVIVSGQARIGSIAVNASNRQVATYDTNLSGYGDYTVGA
jgi:predicted secreted protein